jgi:HAD superfamily hydrolase (TIGR01509 family)
MDGLMLDTEGTSRIAWERALGERGYTISDERYLQLVGISVSDVEKKMRAWYDPSLAFDSIFARKVALADESIASQGVPHKHGLLEFLSAVDSLGLRKVVATSTVRERTLEKLKISAPEGRFDIGVGGDEVPRGKPAPEIFLLAADRLSLPSRECLAFEDSDPGVFAAHAAGMRAVIIPDRKPPSPEAAALAWAVLQDLTQAAEIVRREAHVDSPP